MREIYSKSFNVHYASYVHVLGGNNSECKEDILSKHVFVEKLLNFFNKDLKIKCYFSALQSVFIKIT